MMTTGQIPEHRAVEGVIVAMAMTMTTAGGRRTRRAVQKGPGKGRVQRMGRGTRTERKVRKGWGRERVQGKVLLKKTPGGEDFSRAVAVQKEMYDTDSDTEGLLERVYLEPEASPALSISSDDDSDSTKLDSKYDPELNPDVGMRMEDEVDAADGVDLDGDVDMERDCDDDEEEDEEKEDVEEAEQEDEDEEDDQEEDDGKEPRTLGQGKMVNTSADDVDTMVDGQPIVLPEPGQEMREHTPQQHPPAPTQRPQTPELCPRPRTLDTHPLSGLEYLGLVTLQEPHPAVPTLREPDAAGNSSVVDVVVDVDQQLLIESAGGDSLPDVHLRDDSLPDDPPLNDPLPDVPLPEARTDGSVSEE